MIGNLQFVVAGGDRAMLLEAIDQALHAVALPIGDPIEADPTPRLVGAPGDDGANASPSQVGAHRAAGVALVADDAGGTQTGTPPARSRHGPALQQGLHLRRLMPLAGSQDGADRLAASLGPEVDLGREAAARAAEGLVAAPFLAPAAC
jgi:hypothetical protein